MTFLADARPILRVTDLSSPNGAKWRDLKDLVAGDLKADPDAVYCTYMSKSSNAQVRIGKQMRGDKTYLIALAFGGDGNRESLSYDKWPREAVEKGLTDALVMWFETGPPGSGAWRPERLYYRPGWPHVAAVRAWSPDIQEYVVAGAGSSVASVSEVDPATATSQLAATPLAAIVRSLRHGKNVLLKGVPGVGKTYYCRLLLRDWASLMGSAMGGHRFLALHPSSSYEDLMEGLRPDLPGSPSSFVDDFTSSGAAPSFTPQLGRISSFVKAASQDPERDYVLVLDEVNRTNLAAAFGEFLLLVEASKRASWSGKAWRPPEDGEVALTYSGRRMFVPDNLYVIGTMNAADRSIAPMDRAMVRRFQSLTIEPLDSTLISQGLGIPGSAQGVFDDLCGVWETVNEDVLLPFVGPDGLIGHSFLFDLAASFGADDPNVLVRDALRSAYIPQLVQVLSEAGQEELLNSGTSDQRLAKAQESLRELLERFGLEMALEGLGLGRRLYIRDI